jgi:hypothetical protein
VRVRSADDQRDVEIADESPLNAHNPRYARISADNGGAGAFGLVNSGFDGIALEAGEKYCVSLYARTQSVGAGTIVVRLEDANDELVVEHRFPDVTPTWQKFAAELKKNSKTMADWRCSWRAAARSTSTWCRCFHSALSSIAATGSAATSPRHSPI